MITRWQNGLSMLAVALLTGCADQTGDNQQRKLVAAQQPPFAAEDAKMPPDGAWITLAGAVISSLPGSFVLDYGARNIRVDLDDWDPAYREAEMLRPGDEVVVRGRIDDDLYAAKKIEAGSVYVKNINTYFYGSAAEEESLAYRMAQGLPGPAYVDLVGSVIAVDRPLFTLRTAGREIRVDTTAAENSPFSDNSRRAIEPGNRVYVWGKLAETSGNQRTMRAQAVIRVKPGRGHSPPSPNST